MKQFQKKLTELEVEAEHHLLARQQVIQIYELKLIMFFQRLINKVSNKNH